MCVGTIYLNRNRQFRPDLQCGNLDKSRSHRSEVTQLVYANYGQIFTANERLGNNACGFGEEALQCVPVIVNNALEFQ